MKNRSKKNWILQTVITAAVVVAVIAVVIGIVRGSKKVEVYPVGNIQETIWTDSNSYTGTVTEGRTQKIPLKEGLIEMICVKEGQQVKAGDVLLKYDVGSFQLTLSSDEAKIQLLENNIQKAWKRLNVINGLIPSEYAAQPYETVIHHEADPVDTLTVIDSGTAPSEAGEGNVYYCTPETVVKADFLNALYQSKGTAELKIYENNVAYGSFLIDGSRLGDLPWVKRPTPTPTEAPTPTPTETPGPSPTETPTPAPTEPAAETLSFYKGLTPGAVVTALNDTPSGEETLLFEDWTVGNGVIFSGDGTVSIDLMVPHYGTFSSVVPEESAWDETIITEGDTPDEAGNYQYTKAELSKMAEEQIAQIKNLELDLKGAKLTLEKDKLTAKNGEVLAAIDGVVTEQKDPESIRAGETLMTVAGNETCVIRADVSEMDLSKVKVGDVFDVNGYESGTMTTAKVLEIGTKPTEKGDFYGQNPNNSYYPVLCAVEDKDAALRTNEMCEVRMRAEETSEGLYLLKMYIRSDQDGNYVYVKGENGRLEKRYIQTGKIIWGRVVEVRSGLTTEDCIAFPYGKYVRAGAGVVEKEAPQEQGG